MKRVKWLGILLLILLLMPQTALGEERNIFIDDEVQRLFTSGDGLSSTSSTSIAQTAEGFIWIGGYGGLVRYDGDTLEAFASDQLSNITDLVGGPDGSLWIASADRGLIRYLNDEFQYVTEDASIGREIESLKIDEDGTVYFGTESGVGTVTPDGEVAMLDIPELTDWFIIRIEKLPDGRLLCVTRAGDLYVYTGDSCTAVDLGENSQNVRCVYYDSNEQEVLIGTLTDQVLICDMQLEVKETFTATGMNCINDLLRAETGVLWICSDSGIAAWDDGHLQVQKLEMDNSVDRVMIDREKNYWFVSSRQGVLEVSRSRFGNVSQRAGMEGLVVNAVQKIGSRMYVGHDDGMVILDMETYEPVEDEEFKCLENVRIRSLYADEEDNLWVVTKGKGLMRFNSDRTWTIFSSEDYPEIMSDNFRCIYPDGDSILAGTDQGAYIIRDDQVSNVLNNPDDVSKRVLSICAMNGSYFLGSDGYGLYEVKDGEVVRHLTNDGELTSNVIMKVISGVQEEGLWLVTGNNIAWLSAAGELKNIEHFPSKNNLDLLIMENQEVWIPAGAGIFQTTEGSLLHDEPVETRLFRRSDGVPHEITANSNQYLDGDVLYMCGSGGITSLQVFDESEDDSAYQLVIDTVDCDNERIYVQNQDTLKMRSSVQRIEIHADTLTYKTANPMVYYYLEGFDNEQTRRRLSDAQNISYTNLDGGSYTFHYGILDEETGEPGEEITLKIEKEYRWYETNWIRFLMVFGVVVVVAGITGALTLIRSRKEKRLLMEEYEREERKHLQKIAYVDYLTGLYNRNYLEVWNEKILPEASYPITFIMSDCNNLKKINDRYGHKQGDALLKGMAGFLSEEFKDESSTVFRAGGDEFLIVCCGTDSEQAERRMEHMREAAADFKIEDVPLTFSYGVCTLGEEDFDFEEGLRRSDLEMLLEKDRFHGRSIKNRE